MLPIEIVRKISTYLPVFDSLVLENTLKIQLFSLNEYKKRLFFDPYENNYKMNGRLVNIFTYVSNGIVYSKVLGTLTNFTMVHKFKLSTRDANRQAHKALHLQYRCLSRRLEMVYGL